MAFEELKERQAGMWSAGPYQNITETIRDLHEEVIRRLDPWPGLRWLDLACGTGAVAELAARGGASFVGAHLSPGLIETARDRADEQGLEIEYVVADCEDLPFEDASFEAVSSACGIMFSPDHRASARQLARVTAPAGRIALANWRPDGGVGRAFEAMRPFQPAPPPGVGNPFDWGREEYVEALLGDAFELELEELDSPLIGESGEQIWQLFSTSFGPTKTLAESLDPDLREALHRAYVEVHETGRVNGGIRYSRTYLLTVGARR